MLLVAHRTPATASRCTALSAAGAGVFEVDIQLGDGRLVVSHYLPLPAFLRRVHRDNWRFRWGFPAGGDPELAAALDAVPEDAQILFDPKESEPQRLSQLVDILIDQFRDRDRYRISMTSVPDLARLRTAGFRTWRTVKNRENLAHLLADGAGDDEAISIRHTLVDATTVTRLHAVSPTVIAWTVNSTSRARQLRDLGVDGLTTDSTAVMRALATNS